jgi:threonine aldolase
VQFPARPFGAILRSDADTRTQTLQDTIRRNPIRHDFRSDTVTRPSPAMRDAMAAAEVGDDVFGDDPTVNRLEAEMAARLGKEAALFVPSGTQSNLLALMSQCGRGDEYIAGQGAHCYAWEGGGAAVLGSIQPQPIPGAPDGTLPLDAIEAAIKPDDSHFAITRLLALENTTGGKVLPQAYVEAACALARRHNLLCHLDGARLFNAAAAQNVMVAELAGPFDTVSICLSKGLGAPVGSVLIGPAETIRRARRLRKMVGGGMRQAGLLAAACLYALDHNVARLADDHASAARLAAGLAALGLDAEANTNIVFVDVDPGIAPAFAEHLAEHGIGITGTTRQRWVTHLDVGTADIEAALAAAGRFFAGQARVAAA